MTKKKNDDDFDIDPAKGTDIKGWRRKIQSNKPKKKRGKKPGKCSICLKGPLAGYTFCATCYARLKGRIINEFKANGLDHKDHPETVHKQMEDFKLLAEEKEFITLLPHYKPNCMRCLRSISIARGLCQCCYQFYNKKVHEGITTWDEIVNRGKAYHRSPNQGIAWGTKHKPKDIFEDLDDLDD